jgi:hypothetical protein
MKHGPHLPALHGTSAPHHFFQALVETGPALPGCARPEAALDRRSQGHGRACAPADDSISSARTEAGVFASAARR